MEVLDYVHCMRKKFTKVAFGEYSSGNQGLANNNIILYKIKINL